MKTRRGRLLLPILLLSWATSSVAADCDCDTLTSILPPYPPLEEGEPAIVIPHPDPESLLDHEDPQLAANKRLVYDMWRTLMNAGHLEKTEQFLKEDYMQHNQTARTGREAFVAFFSEQIERQDEIPERVQDPIVTIAAEGDYVVMAFVTHYPEPDGSGTYTSTHFDMFRIEDGLIAQHWDSVQRPAGLNLPGPDEGGPLPIRGVSGLDQLPWLRNDNQALANNKRLVFDLWRHLPEAGREELAELYLDPIYIQHNPNAVTGRDGVVEYFAQRPDSPIEPFIEDPLVAMIAEGDAVIQVLQEERPDPDRPGEIYYVAWFDMFRVVEGRLAEHWDTASKGELPASMQDLEP